MNRTTKLILFAGMFAMIGLTLFSAGSNKLGETKIHSKKVVYVKTQEKLNQVLAENKLVVIDFYADWCPPCRQLAPHIGKLADSHDGRVKVVKVDVDEAGELAKAFDVQSIPALFVVKDGKKVSQEAGYKSYEDLVKWIEKYESVKS